MEGGVPGGDAERERLLVVFLAFSFAEETVLDALEAAASVTFVTGLAFFLGESCESESAISSPDSGSGSLCGERLGFLEAPPEEAARGARVLEALVFLAALLLAATVFLAGIFANATWHGWFRGFVPNKYYPDCSLGTWDVPRLGGGGCNGVDSLHGRMFLSVVILLSILLMFMRLVWLTLVLHVLLSVVYTK